MAVLKTHKSDLTYPHCGRYGNYLVFRFKKYAMVRTGCLQEKHDATTHGSGKIVDLRIEFLSLPILHKECFRICPNSSVLSYGLGFTEQNNNARLQGNMF